MNRTTHRTATRIPAIAISVAAALAIAAGTAAPALADDGYNYTAYTSVTCDAGTARMVVTATGTTFSKTGPLLNRLPTEYDNGQWVRFDVLVREAGQTTWSTVYDWSDWLLLRSVQTSADLVIDQPTDLGTNVVQGQLGHSYEVLVQADYWTGEDNLYELPTTYRQSYATDGFNSYTFEPSRCIF